MRSSISAFIRSASCWRVTVDVANVVRVAVPVGAPQPGPEAGQLVYDVVQLRAVFGRSELRIGGVGELVINSLHRCVRAQAVFLFVRNQFTLRHENPLCEEADGNASRSESDTERN